MEPFGLLACGPSGPLLLLLGGLALGSVILIVSFLVGFLCLFTSRWKLGLWLTALPLTVGGLAYLLLQGQSV